MGAIIRKIKKASTAKNNKSENVRFEVKKLTKEELDNRRCHAYQLLVP